MIELTLNNVKYTYKSKYQTVNALKGVSYDFYPGKFYREKVGRDPLFYVVGPGAGAHLI